ncbi:MAG TPA: chemotaxis protein CheW [Syntrophorhabdaceae bacterium]|nr:chemotaxis protein CheW [Syntrophorhabdaceae bacterium]
MGLVQRQSHCWKTIGIFGDSSCPELTSLVHCRNCSIYNKAGRGLFDRDMPIEFIEEATKNLSSIKEKEIEDYLSVIIFRVEKEWLAFKTIYLQETTSIRPVHRVPFRTNNVFMGVANINGELLLCISLARLLEYTPDEEKVQQDQRIYRRMIVINKNGERYVFPVDEVLGIYRIPINDIEEPPVTLTKSPSTFIEGIFNLQDNKVGLLNEDSFLQALKRSIIS